MVEAMPNFYNRLRARKFNSVSDTALEIAPSSSATPNFTIDAGGKLNWSSGSANADTTLYRSAANTLKTDDSFDVASGHTYKIDGADVLSATSLGSSVVDSSLTSLGTVTSLNATTGTISNLTSSTPNFYGPLTNTGTSTFSGTVKLQQSKEKFTVSTATVGPAAAVDVDILDGAVYYYTGTIIDGFKFNIRGNSYTTLASLLTTDQESITIVLMIQNTGPGLSFASSNYFTIDTNATVSIKWFGGSKPAGNGSSTDVYTFTIYKTGTSAFTVFASQSKFA
jgi:hypothetical protein